MACPLTVAAIVSATVVVAIGVFSALNKPEESDLVVGRWERSYIYALCQYYSKSA